MSKMVPKFHRLSESQKRDLNCYLESAQKITAFQIYTPNDNHVSGSIDEWFFLWDTHGIKSSFEDNQLCGKIIQAKATLNLTIKLWVEDIVGELGILRPDEVWDYCHYLPSWTWSSFAGQLKKLAFQFRWQKIEMSPDGKIYWPAWQVEFDPSI